MAFAADHSISYTSVCAITDSAHVLLSIASSNATSTAGYPYEVSPDGQRILTTIAAGAKAAEPVTLIQNWAVALKK